MQAHAPRQLQHLERQPGRSPVHPKSCHAKDAQAHLVVFVSRKAGITSKIIDSHGHRVGGQQGPGAHGYLPGHQLIIRGKPIAHTIAHPHVTGPQQGDARNRRFPALANHIEQKAQLRTRGGLHEGHGFNGGQALHVRMKAM
eukprot:1157870-Pelagomonas_calceolata.AAC.3